MLILDSELCSKISAGTTFTPHDSELRLIDIIKNLLN
jgi:hypothetical protein